MKYRVKQYYYDSGRTDATIDQVDDDYIAISENRKTHDYYEELFDTYAEAKKNAKETLMA